MKFYFPKKKRHLPKPTGPYAVGCTDVMTSCGTSGVIFRLFYPSVPVKGAKSPEWLPDKNYLKGFAIYFKMWPPLFIKSFPRFVGEINTSATWNTPPVTNSHQRFPVIVFSHGLGGCRTSYTTVCLELASNGYVVAAMEHRDYSAAMSFFCEESNTKDLRSHVKSETNTDTKDFPNSGTEYVLKKRYILLRKVKANKHEYLIRNKQVHQRAKECSLALDWLRTLNAGHPIRNVLEPSFPLNQFRGILDISRVSIAGHSFGGATVIATMAADKRFKVGIGLDTWMLPLTGETSTFSTVNQPMLFVNMEGFQTEGNLRIMKKMDSCDTQHRKIITLKGAVHLNQSDLPFVCDRAIRRLFGAHSRLDRFEAMDLTTRLTLAFLSKHLDIPANENHKNYLQLHQHVMQEGINLT